MRTTALGPVHAGPPAVPPSSSLAWLGWITVIAILVAIAVVAAHAATRR